MIQKIIEAINTKDADVINSYLDNYCAFKAPETALVFNLDTIIKYLQNIEEIIDFSAYLSYYTIDFIIHDSPHIMKLKLINDKIRAMYIEQETTLKRIRLDIEYDGSHYNGFQRQNHQPTIQKTLENSLSKLLNEKIIIHGASRTDALVHAEHQVLHFDTNNPLPCDSILNFINHLLPNDIVVKSVAIVPQVFHARFDALMKTYTYRVIHKHDPFKAHYRAIYPKIDIEQLNEILNPLIGTHDFLSFSKLDKEKNTVRTITEAKAIKHHHETWIIIKGNGFLRHMVRLIVGQAFEDIRRNTQILKEALKNPQIGKIKYLAPPEGLYLSRVEYINLTD